VSEIAGSSLEQTTFFRRNLAVKLGPQVDVSSEMDDVTTDADASATDGQSLLYHRLYVFLQLFSVHVMACLVCNFAECVNLIRTSSFLAGPVFIQPI